MSLCAILTAGTGFADLGCGGSAAATDAGTGQNAELVILSPPGDSIGLGFGGSATLRVSYLGADGYSVAGEPVQFQMLSGPGEDPGGSTLSQNSSITDTLGVATVDLLAGAERTNFRVEVSAANAPSAWFYVAVSEDGFTDLKIMPTHRGWRPAESFERVELRIYRAAELRCVDLDVDDLQPSVFPPRSLDGFTGSVTFANLGAGAAYTLVGWALVPGSTTRVAVGCVDLGARQVVPGPMLLTMMVDDRPAALPQLVPLQSTFDLTPVADAVTDLDRSWQVLACPDGPGQLVLDCTLDAVAPDDALDCVVTGSNAIVEAAAPLRGAPDGAGCRPASAGGDDSLDHRLTAAIAAGGSFPTEDDLAVLLAARRDALSGFTLSSELVFVSDAATRHRLEALTLVLGGVDFTVDLRTSDRPVLDAPQVAVTRTEQHLDLADHHFTLRYGRAAAAAFRALALEPAGLSERSAELGTALVESTHDATSDSTGCTAISAILCDAIGSADPSCVAVACTEAQSALDGDLAAWAHRLDGPDLDFALAGTAPIYDFDDDLEIDTVGTDHNTDATGIWSAQLTLSDGNTIGTIGVFGSIQAVP